MMTTSVQATAVAGREANEFTELVLKARAGDLDAFGDLVESLWPQLVALARGILATDEEAEDLVQESLVHAWQRLWMIRRPESFAAWVRRIVTRRCLTRAKRRRPREELRDLGEQVPTPGERLDAARLLAMLAPRQRAVLYLTWIEGYTDKEAGRLLGMRPATVRVHRFRGLRRLQGAVEGVR